MKQLLPILRPYRWMALAAALLVFTQALCEIYLPRLMASIVDLGVVRGDTGHILSVGSVMVVVAAFGMAAAFLGRGSPRWSPSGSPVTCAIDSLPTSPTFRCTSLTRWVRRR